MLVPIVVTTAAVCCYKLATSKKGEMTPQRQQIYDQAMVSLADPAKLRELAASFQKEGLKYEAGMLNKRAALRELPQEVKEERRKVLQDALKSENKEGIANVANAFEKEGALGAAQRLREYLAGLM